MLYWSGLHIDCDRNDAIGLAAEADGDFSDRWDGMIRNDWLCRLLVAPFYRIVTPDTV